MKIPHKWQRVFDAICRVSMDYYDVRGGNPDNPGQFSSSGGSAGSKAIKQSKKSSGKQPLTAGSNKSIPQTHRSIVDALTAKSQRSTKTPRISTRTPETLLQQPEPSKKSASLVLLFIRKAISPSR